MYRPDFSDLYPQGLWDHNQRLTCGLIYDIIRLVQLLSNFMGAIPRASAKPVDWNKT